MLPRETIIKELMGAINRSFNDAWVRGEMYKDPHKVTLTKVKLYNAFLDSYEKLQLNSTADRAGGALPPSTELEEAGVFEKAATRAMRYANDLVYKNAARSKNRALPNQKRRSDRVVFLQTHATEKGKKQIFNRIKGISIQFINNYLTSGVNGRTPIKGLSTVKELIDAGMSKEEALRASEDVNYRRGIHRQHLGSSAVGMGRIAAQIQTYGALVDGFSEALFTTKKSNYITDLIGKASTVFEMVPTKEGYVSVRVKRSAKIDLSLCSFKLNAPGMERFDFKTVEKSFNRTIEGIISKLPLGKLESFANVEQLRQHLGNELTELIGTKVSGAVYNKTQLAAKDKKTRYEKALPLGKTQVAEDAKHKAKGIVSQEETTTFSEEALRTAAYLKLELQKKIRGVVTKNMESPYLVYRTGRFASSINIENVTITEKLKMPSIQYNYMLYPYQVFEPGHAMYTEFRDPHKLISKSIREIAAEMMISRLSIKRAK